MTFDNVTIVGLKVVERNNEMTLTVVVTISVMMLQEK